MFKIVKIVKNGGYMACRTIPPHPNKNKHGYYALHRVVMENKLGRLLSKEEHVHHIDGNIINNLQDNLVVLTRSEHAKVHHQEKAPKLIDCSCHQCGKKFSILPSNYKRRIKMSKTKVLFCSRSCGTKYNRPPDFSGIRHSRETKQKISASMKRAWEDRKKK